MQLKNTGHSLMSKRASLWGKIQRVWQNYGVQVTAALIYDLDLAVSTCNTSHASTQCICCLCN